MALPTAPTELGTAKLHFLADSTATTPAAKNHAAIETAASGEAAYPIGFAGIATHRSQDLIKGSSGDGPGGFVTDGNGPCVLIAGIDDPTTNDPVQPLVVVNEEPAAGAFGLVARLAAGNASIGKLGANSGVDIGDVDVTSIVPGTGATALGKAIDTAAGATDTGIAALAIRDDALTTLTPIDGDYVPLRVSSTGALHVTGGGGGTEYTEDVATPAPIVGTATMMERDDALATLTPIEGDWVGLRSTSKGALWVGVDGTVTVDGSAVTQPISHSTLAVLGSGTEADALRVTIANNSSGILSVDDGSGSLTVDNAALSVTGGGTEASALRVTIANNSTGVVSIDDNASSITVDDGAGSLTVDNAGTFAVQADSVIPGTGATNLGKAIDTAGGATDTGIAALAIRDDALTTLTPVDGDYVALRVNATGALHVTGGGGGTEYTEDVATPAAITGTATMMERDDALGGLTPVAGDWAAMRCDANGALWVRMDGTATVDGSAVTQPVSHSSLAVTGGGTEAAAMRVTIANNSTGVVSIDDNGGSLTVDNAGTFAVQVDAALPAGTNAIGKLAANTGVDIGDVDVTSVIPGTGATALGKAEDAAHTSGDVGVMAMAVRQDTPAALAGTDADYQPLITDATGRLHVAPNEETDSINQGATALTVKFAKISAATSGNNTLVTGVTNKKIRVLSMFLVASGTAISVYFDDGGSTAIFGDSTNKIFLDKTGAAGAVGFSLDYNPKGWFETTVTDALRINLSAAQGVAGGLTYVLA